jgi:hypothetical protein
MAGVPPFLEDAFSAFFMSRIATHALISPQEVALCSLATHAASPWRMRDCSKNPRRSSVAGSQDGGHPGRDCRARAIDLALLPRAAASRTWQR